MRRTDVWKVKSWPAQMAGPGTLYLRFQSAATLQRAKVHLAGAREQDGVVSLPVGPDLVALARFLSQTFSLTEQTATRAIFEQEGQPLSIRECFEVENLQNFIARAQSGWFLAMIAENRFSTHFQPIVSCGRTDAVFAYEGLLRGNDGNKTVAPLELMGVARGLDLLTELDGLARRSAICSAAKHRLRAKIFVNLNPQSLQEPEKMLRESLQIVEDAGLLREQIVFEIVESECIRDANALFEACARLKKAGFGIALDDLGSAYSSLRLLGQLRPDYVKLDRELMAEVDKDSFKATLARKLLEAAHEMKIRTIAEGIETPGEADWLRRNGGDFAQGFYFARPAANPPVMAQSGGHFWTSPMAFAA